MFVVFVDGLFPCGCMIRLVVDYVRLPGVAVELAAGRERGDVAVVPPGVPGDLLAEVGEEEVEVQALALGDRVDEVQLLDHLLGALREPAGLPLP